MAIPALRIWYRSTFGHAAVGCVLLWAAMPPLNLWPLAWLAPIWWVLLIRQRQWPGEAESEEQRATQTVAGGEPRAESGEQAADLSLAPSPPPSISPSRSPRLHAALLLLASCGFFAAWLAVTGLSLKVQYHGYWAAELAFWPVGLALLAVAAHLARRRPYVVLWLVGFAFLLAAIHWLRLPHWATGFAWLLISAFFAFWLPLFVGLSRVAVHVLRVPVVVAAPMVWTGVELLRAHSMTGVTHGSLGYAQYPWIALIQVADLAGVYGVSFIVMFVAACLARMVGAESREQRAESGGLRIKEGESGRGGEGESVVPSSVVFVPSPPLPLAPSPPRPLALSRPARIAYWPLLPAAAMLAAALAYGYWRMSGTYTQPGPRIALIQGAAGPQAELDEAVRYQIFVDYVSLSRKALGKYNLPASASPLDLLVWPETMFVQNYRTWNDDAIWDRELARVPEQQHLAWRDEGRRTLALMAQTFNVPLLIGVTRQHFETQDRPHYLNSAVLVTPGHDLPGRYAGPTGPPPGCYDKNYVLMFAEYVPLAEYFPVLQRLTPLSVGAEAAEQPVALRLGRFRISPNICYESVLPHEIGRQIRTLQDQGNEPDVLVNLTNDAWFWGASELDMHLIRGVFRAVECRKPFLICANAGISASIDSDGHVVVRGDRGLEDTLLAETRIDQRRSWYLAHGDWLPGGCLAICVAVTLVGSWSAMRRQRSAGSVARNDA